MIKCDICSGILMIEYGGYGRCIKCGMPYSIDRIREKLNGNNKKMIGKTNLQLEPEFVIENELIEENYSVNVLKKVNHHDGKIVIPDSVNYIGDYLNGSSIFENGEVVEVIEFGKNVDTIGSHAFQGCKNLKKIVIPNGISSYGYELSSGYSYAFDGCESLERVVFGKYAYEPHNVCKGLFKNCKNLKRVILPENINTINESMFEGCESLQRITIPDSVVVISKNAFKGCKNLKCVIMPNHKMLIHPSAFEGCVFVPNKMYVSKKKVKKCPICGKKIDMYKTCKGCLSVLIQDGFE